MGHQPEPDHSAEELAERVFTAALGTFDLFALYVGDRLPYYELLGKQGPLPRQASRCRGWYGGALHT
jgi:hypothetical protein